MSGPLRFPLALLACAALAACAGGGSRAVSPPVQAKAAQGTVTATLRIPAVKRAVHGRRTPLWIPAAAQGVAVTFWAQGTTQPETPNAVFDVSATSARCTTDATGRTCKLTITAPAGPISAVLSLYDAVPSGGLPQGSVLARGTAIATITPNASNTVAIVAFGVPASLAVTPVAIVNGVAATVSPLVIVADAAGDAILTDSYDSAVVVTVSDAGTTITPSSIDLHGPLDAATFSYDGGAISGQPKFTATGGGASAAANITVRPSPTPSPSPTPTPSPTPSPSPSPTPVPIADSPIVACMAEGIALVFPAGVTGDTAPTAITLSGTGLRACEFLPNGHLLWIDSRTVHEADFTTGADLRTFSSGLPPLSTGRHPLNALPSSSPTPSPAPTATPLLADVSGDFNGNVFASTTAGLVYGWTSIAASGSTPTFSLVNGTQAAGIAINMTANLWALNPATMIPNEIVPSSSAFTTANIVVGPALAGSVDLGFDTASNLVVIGSAGSDACVYVPPSYLGGTTCLKPATAVTLPVGVTPGNALAVDNAGVFYRNAVGQTGPGIYVMSVAAGNTPLGVISGPSTLLGTYTLVDLAVAPGHSVQSYLTGAQRITDTVLRRPRATRPVTPRAPLHDEASGRGR